jgi:hypothetical protein
MTLTTIVVADISNPIEVQAWMNANPQIVVEKMFIQQNVFYILY